jgi:hypothetical protein
VQNVFQRDSRVSFQISPTYFFLFFHSEPSVVDDLISLAYSFIHILKESLPWAEYIDASGQPTDLQGIIILKTLVQPQALCADLDSVFSDFLSYVQKLRRSASCRDIDYDSHIQAFRDFFESKFKGRV